MTRTLWVTNDFPPRSGGIEQYLAHLLGFCPPEETRVLASPWPGDREHDATVPYRVDRVGRRPLLPSPGLGAAIRRHADEHGAEVVVFGASWPLGELGRWIDRPTLAFSYGREAGMVRFGLARLMTRVARANTAVTVLSEFTSRALEPIFSEHARVELLPAGVDTTTFTPGADGAVVRARHGIAPDQPVVTCVSRLVPRKGQDVLIEAWPRVQSRVPGAHLLLVGTGPAAEKLRRRVEALGLEAAVTLTGEVPWSELPAHYAAGDVFAMPCRTRWAGMDVEGLGIVYLEAQACGVPVVAGRSGGAPETVLDGETGIVVDGASARAVADAVVELLRDPVRRAAMGDHARRFVEDSWSWPVMGRSLLKVLAELAATA